MKIFKSKNGNIPTPLFFPDATRAVLRTLDSVDIKNTKTAGVLVNTYHLYENLGSEIIKKYKGVGKLMNFDGGIISDSGGFQVMSIAKKSGGKITDEGVVFRPSKNKKQIFTPEISISYQFDLKTDMVVALDDFTPPDATETIARDTVERTILWAKRSKDQFEIECKKRKLKKDQIPYFLGVVQGGHFQKLRAECAQRLASIGFDGFGYGGWPINDDKTFDYESAKTIADNTPDNYFLYGLGIGKPHEIVELCKLGYNIFDCVLPTRDARHGRLYVYNATSIDEINLKDEKFYSYFTPNKDKHLKDTNPISKACDCLLCSNYSRGYLAHLFKIGDSTALRLATIHNLRFYSILMEKIRSQGA